MNNTIKLNRFLVGTSSIVALAFALQGCGNNNGEEHQTATAPETEQPAEAAPAEKAAPALEMTAENLAPTTETTLTPAQLRSRWQALQNNSDSVKMVLGQNINAFGPFNLNPSSVTDTVVAYLGYGEEVGGALGNMYFSLYNVENGTATTLIQTLGAAAGYRSAYKLDSSTYHNSHTITWQEAAVRCGEWATAATRNAYLDTACAAGHVPDYFVISTKDFANSNLHGLFYALNSTETSTLMDVIVYDITTSAVQSIQAVETTTETAPAPSNTFEDMTVPVPPFSNPITPPGPGK